MLFHSLGSTNGFCQGMMLHLMGTGLYVVIIPIAIVILESFQNRGLSSYYGTTSENS
jgi:hypothetical protein